MKKIYSTLSMLVAGAIVASAANFVVENPKFSTFQPLKELKTNLPVLGEKQTPSRSKVRSKAIEISNLQSGGYINGFFPMFVGFLELERSSTVNITVNGNEVEFAGLGGWDDSVRANFVSNIKGQIDGDKIVLPLGQVLGSYTSAGTSYDIVLASLGQSGPIVEGKIEMVVEDGKLVCDYYIAEWVDQLGWWDGQGGATIYAPNAICTYNRFSPVFETTADPIPTEIPVYCAREESEFGDDFILTNPGFRGGYLLTGSYEDDNTICFSDQNAESITYDYDDDDNPIVDEAMMVAVYQSPDNKNYGSTELYASFNEGETEYTWPVGDITLKNSSTGEVFEFPFNYWAFWAIGENSQGYGHGFWTPATLKKIDTEGVENVNANFVNNSNAPVEYFNLQGVRINNPANGQLVIRRQGTDVKKVIL